jgi:hypothetical protein
MPFQHSVRSRSNLAGVALLAVLVTAGAPATAEEKPQWRRAVEAANELSYECFGEKKNADCEAMIRHYDAAMAAPDADEGVRHEVFKYRLNAVAVHGGHLVEAGDTAEALSVLYAGHTEMRKHLDGGKHAHTVIDNLRLQGHFLKALVASGDLDNAETVVDLPRQLVPQYYEALEKSRGNERVLSLIVEGVVRSEELETGYGHALIAHADALGSDPRAKAVRADAIVAYRNALQWLQRGDAEGWTLPFEGTNAIRFAALNNALGKALLASGDRGGAVGAHNLAFVAASCKGFDDGSLHDFDKITAARPCREAVAGYMAASGETQQLAKDAADAMYRRQMDLYGTDINTLLRAAPKQAD